jgi:hypothetical protein
MEKLGFRMLTNVEFRATFERLGLVAPRPRWGKEVGFLFAAHRLAVCVWTTWLLREMRAREEDAGWVVVVQRDRAVYFGGPIHRVGNFFNRLYAEAFLAHARVLNRPFCKEHRSFLDITYGRGLGSRYWVCPHGTAHADGGLVTASWDGALPEAVRAVVETRRRQRQLSRKYRLAMGQQVNIARLIRRPWMTRYPERAVSSR